MCYIGLPYCVLREELRSSERAFTVRPNPFNEIADNGDEHVLLAARKPDFAVAPFHGFLSEFFDEYSFCFLLALQWHGWWSGACGVSQVNGNCPFY